MNFNKSYERDTFIEFLRDLIPAYSPDIREVDFEASESSYITDIKSLGHVDPSFSRSKIDEFGVFEVVHKSENDPRVSLTRESFKFFEQNQIDVGILAFRSETSDNWRLSLITSEVVLEDGKIKSRFSNPRRFSFYLGPDAKTRTPREYLKKKGEVVDFEDLKSRFDIDVLTKEFYQKLSNWYFWALDKVKFPEDAEKQEGGRNLSVIRLINRLVFIWFMKRKGFVEDQLFEREHISEILKDLDDSKSNFYKAILQNLFFATLNTPISERRFRDQTTGHKGYNPDFGKNHIYRYEDYFEKPDQILEYFKDVPFLNGGLFECLDRKEEEPRKYIDGFSDTSSNQPTVPNELFFSSKKDVDLSEHYKSGHESEEVQGLIPLLNRYNFTIDENTPIDQEVSLDPELLGRIFENLLASYNPETASTARKATGSYYTPRPIVDFMVDESLKEYFKGQLLQSELSLDDPDEELDKLLSYQTTHSQLEENKHVTKVLVKAIHALKIIDPAVGSGAFPMGILQKLVLVLNKLDKNNTIWAEINIEAVKEKFPDDKARVAAIKQIEKDFGEERSDDFGRKLYLIQNCIYGVDLQPIAVQIAKLRFFISLLVDESDEKSNIKPLPNLETKIIPANSLIGLKEEQQHSLRSPRIDKLEQKLVEARQDYFNASYPEQKKEAKRKDDKIREELSNELENSVFSAEIVEQLAKWDPFNVNKSADFFDPEWMFGITDGFDIVIANPPYGAEIDKTLENKIQKRLTDASHKNSASYFIDFAKNLWLKPSGVVSFIVPKSLLYSQGWHSSAESLVNKTKKLVDVETAFENVKLEQAIFIFTNRVETEKYDSYKFTDGHFSFCNSIKTKRFFELGTWVCEGKKIDFDIFDKIRNVTYMREISTTKRGIGLQRYIQEESEDSKKIIGGRYIRRFFVDGFRGYVPKKHFENSRKKEFILSPKIVTQDIIAHIQNPIPHVKITSAFDPTGELFTLDTVQNTILNTNKFSYRFIVAFLNSKLASWYTYRFIYASAIRTMHFDNYYIGKLPIPNMDTEEQKKIEVIVKTIENLRANKTGTDEFEKHLYSIDQIFFDYFSLNKQEREYLNFSG